LWTAHRKPERCDSSVGDFLSDSFLVGLVIRVNSVSPILEATMRSLLQDVRYSLRTLSKSPGFTAIVILTLALGIGANTAIFSVVNAVLLAPLPYNQPNRLVMVWSKNVSKGYKMFPVSGGDYAEWKSENSVFENMAASSDTLYTLTGAGEPQIVIGYQFSADYFRLLGAASELGRTFLDEEDRPGGADVVVLGDAIWRRTFGADPNIVGKSITLTGKPFTVVGVMPPDFRYPSLVELWTPLGLKPSFLADYDQTALRVLARLKPGVTLNQAQTEMDIIQQRIAQAHPKTDSGNGVNLVPLREQIAGDVKMPLLVLLGAVGFVLLITCANIANLMLARAAGRRKEIAIRTALGASRARLIRQFLVESLLLSLAGGALGLVFANGATGFLLAIFPNNIANLSIPQVASIPMDARVFSFTLLAALLTGVLFGLAPVLGFRTTTSAEGLKETSSSTTASSGERRVRSVLVVCEFALALVLLVGAGLLITSFRNLLRGNLGFDADRILSAQLFLSSAKYPPAQREKRLAFVNDALNRISELPGVESVGAAGFMPLSGFWGEADFTVQGQPEPAPGQRPSAKSDLVTPDYFRAMGISLLKGRVFTDQDRKGTAQVVVINETLAHKEFGNQNPVGRQLNFGDSNKPDLWEVVGVVSDIHDFGLEEQVRGNVFRPFAQIPLPVVGFVVRTSGRPSSLTSAVKQAIWTVDKDQPIYKIIGVDQLASESLGIRRASSVLLGAFSALALLLAGLGIYGVMAFSVAQRTREIGVRMALGAQPDSVLKMIMGYGMKIVIVGMAIGVAGALALSRVVAGLLYGVKATDGTTFLFTSLSLAFVALIACYIPARRAMRVDPMVALRYE
jgi:putative ABC transport system permease protein